MNRISEHCGRRHAYVHVSSLIKKKCFGTERRKGKMDRVIIATTTIYPSLHAAALVCASCVYTKV